MKNKNLMPEKFNIKDWDNLFNIYKDESDNYFYNLSNSLIIDDEINPVFYDEYHSTEYDNLYHISHKFYDDVNLWWIIAYANDLVNPFDLENKSLKILKKPVVNQIINSLI